MKQSLIKFFNAYWLKEYILLWKYYKLSFAPAKRPLLVSVIDHRRNCQGLTDRFKGIVSVYALAKAMNIEYKCIFTHPFLLSEFLVPNQYNWLPEADELSDSLTDVRFRIMRKEPSVKRLMNILPSRKQVLVYANIDYLEQINQAFNCQFTWGSLFNELFIPNERLQKQLDYHLNIIKPGEYIACVFRFQTLLGDFQEYHYKSLSNSEEREQLLKKNVDELLKLVQAEQCTVLVTSDSSTFIEAVSQYESIYTLPGKVVHMDCITDEKDEVYLKSFVDFFMLSKARKVYSMGTKQMYPTAFPFYAAKINDVPFERILID